MLFVDKFGGVDNQAFFGVFDGHGGRQVVEYVVKMLPKVC